MKFPALKGGAKDFPNTGRSFLFNLKGVRAVHINF
jgi:hypothetical protein